MSKFGLLLRATVLSASLVSFGAAAQELKIGLKTEPTSLDPQYHALTPNIQVSSHLFDALVFMDGQLRPQPSLAQSWKALDDTTWEFKLRPGVKFHNGTPLTADDVIFTFSRVPKVPNSPSPFTLYIRQVDSIVAVDPLTLKITTKGPAPLLPLDLANIPIMSKASASGSAPEGKTTAELNRGEGLIGTGPFKFVEWQPGARIVLERFDDYWGPKPEWKRVTLRPLTNAAGRVAALLSGDVDLIEDPPTDDLTKLKSDPKLTVAQAVSSRLVFIHFDTFGPTTPSVTGTDGKNPFKDKRVREALSIAIDRAAIVDKVMAGVGLPAADFLPYPMFGTSKDTKPIKADPALAKKLLADAGYPNGFGITLGTPSGRYINDDKVAQAVAAMWTRIGVKTQVEASAPAVFFKNRDDFKYSAYLAGWAAATGETSNSMRSLVATPDPQKGMGTSNKGRYSNPALDAKLIEAANTIDEKKREAILKEASLMAMADYALAPLHFELSVWAMKKSITYAGRADQATLSQYITTKK